MKMIKTIIVGCLLAVCIPLSGLAQVGPATVAQIGTPDRVETRLGTLKFFDGLPDKATVAKLYDNLDFMHGVEVFLDLMPGASVYAFRQGCRELGIGNSTLVTSTKVMDSKHLGLTPNTETVYAFVVIDLKNGPVVVDLPPHTLGMVNDAWQRHVADVGNAGPDRGQGGKYLFLPPGYKEEAPQGYFVFRSPTYANILLVRGFLVNGDAKPAVENFKRLHLYPLAQAANPPEQKIYDLSDDVHKDDVNKTVFASDFMFFEQVNQVVQEEPTEALDPELGGLLASIGIVKGKPFAPDARMKKLLTEAAAVGSATARSMVFATRYKEAYYYPNSGWKEMLAGGSCEFLKDGYRNLEARSAFHFYALFLSPALVFKRAGLGSQYAYTEHDAAGNYLDGGKTYRLHLPPNIPVKDFWSIIVYDSQTRSLLQTDNPIPSINSYKKDLANNADGSIDLYFGPKPPAGPSTSLGTGHESNWIQTVSGKSWNTMLRLYGPLQPWFDKTWRPGEIELVK